MSERRSARIAILAAQVEEIAPLLARLGARYDGRDATARHWRSDLDGVAIAVCGMGRRRARSAAGALLDRSGASRLLVVGVAGALTRDLAVGDQIVAEVLSNEQGEVLRPDPLGLSRARELGARRAGVLTVDRMVATPAERETLLRALRSVRHLQAGDRVEEGFAVGSAAAVDMESYDAVAEAVARGVAATVLRAISDTASETLPAFLADAFSSDGDLDRGRVIRHAITRPSSLPVLLRLRRRVRHCSERNAELVMSLLAGQ